MELLRLYIFVILGGNSIGVEEKCTGSIENFHHMSTQNSIILNWTLPNEYKNEKPSYIITYRNLGKKRNLCQNTLPHEFEERSAVSSSFHIINLEPFSKYLVNIRFKEISSYLYILENCTLDTLGIDQITGDELDGVRIKRLNASKENITFKLDHINCSKIVGEIYLDIRIFCKDRHCETTGKSNHIDKKPLDNLTITFTFNPHLKSCENYHYKAQLCKKSNVCQSIHGGKFRIDPSTNETPKVYCVDVKWNKNNTLKLFWNCNFSITRFKIMITEEHNWNKTFNYSIHSNNVFTRYNYSVSRVFASSKLVMVKITAINDTYFSKPAIYRTSSYPPLPIWMDQDVSLERHTTTISVKLKILRNEEFLSSSFLFILIKSEEPNGHMDNANVKKLENILEINFSDASKIRVVGSIDLSVNNIYNIYYQIGNSTYPQIFRHTNFSDLSQIEINNNPLEEDVCFDVIILPVNEFRKKYTYKLYFSNMCTKTNFPSAVFNSKDTMSWWILVVLLVCVAAAIFVMYKNRTMKPTEKTMQVSVSENLPTINTNNYIYNEEKPDESLILTMNEYEEIQENELNDSLMSKIVVKEVHVKNYEEYVKKSISNEELQKQHSIFRKGLVHPCETGRKSENRLKNRYNNLIAYDHSRVKLAMKGENECSDYINANYINDSNEQKAYIATQGPLPQTISDFWTMIWQEKVKLIVMLANIYEDGKKRVEQYWPDKNEKRIYGSICIRYRSVEFFEDYDYRIFSVTCEGEMRQVYQIHFTSWPGQGIPLYPHTLVPVIKRMQEVEPSFDSPIVVHCSAGVGRTGTILLCDICMRMAKEKGVVDMVNTLGRLREQRPNMVDNDEQYKLAHLVVLDCLMGLITEIKCDEDLNQFASNLLNNNKHKKEINYLEENKWRDEAMKSVTTVPRNSINYPAKIRNSTFVPENQGRINLSKYPFHDESMSYINAVWVHGYRSPEKFIVAQQPMPNTLGDFWRLIVEKRIRIVVSLNEINLMNETSCKFWPNEEEPEIHPVDFISVIFDGSIDYTYFDIFSVRVFLKDKNQEDDIQVKIYSLKNWSASIYLPPSCEEFLYFLERINGISSESRHMLVTCLDGVTASGIYVALSYVIDRMKVENVCDICLSVRTIRHNRKQFIVNDIQYGFLYSAALSWLQQQKISQS